MHISGEAERVTSDARLRRDAADVVEKIVRARDQPLVDAALTERLHPVETERGDHFDAKR